ncbi:MAG: hypothetical protein KAZ94_03165 [Burkholderiales bacterium]|nr:hypothetical protein [Burkholderiales bacterium]MBP9768390.1 hypothetical protein [Burkholderiales bacterium]
MIEDFCLEEYLARFLIGISHLNSEREAIILSVFLLTTKQNWRCFQAPVRFARGNYASAIRVSGDLQLSISSANLAKLELHHAA